MLSFKTLFRRRNCFLLSVSKNSKDGDGLNLEKFGPTFSSFTDSLPARINEKIIRVSAADKICDIFFIILQGGAFYVPENKWEKA